MINSQRILSFLLLITSIKGFSQSVSPQKEVNEYQITSSRYTDTVKLHVKKSFFLVGNPEKTDICKNKWYYDFDSNWHTIEFNNRRVDIYGEVDGWFKIANASLKKVDDVLIWLSAKNTSYISGIYKKVSVDIFINKRNYPFLGLQVKEGYIDTLILNNVGQGVSIIDSRIGVLKREMPGKWNSFWIKNTQIDSVAPFYGDFTDTISLSNIDFSHLRGKFDISHITNHPIIYISQTDITKIKFNIPATTVRVRSDQPYEEQLIIYQNLLKIYQDAGYTFKYEEYDKQYQELKYLVNGHPIINFISKYWWDYGYDKGRVIFISLGLYLAFMIMNIVLLSKVKAVYWPEKFQLYEATLHQRRENGGRLHKLKYHVNKTLSVALFTGYIFWGIKLDLKELELRHRYVLFLIISQYILGIICLAYIANFVISK
ncbi:MAG: hypothetical protein EOP46_03825 [Sphingobacteriaceae bacterium]|nr:MAG: hypothetical protein EOP46_03825 [Sphingobacteriaceae bacterium]